MIASNIFVSVLEIQPHPELQEKGLAIMAIMFVVSLFNTAVLSYAILRSRWRGWKIVVTIFWVYFSVNVFLSQIETLYFNDSLVIPLKEILSFIITGALNTAVFAPVSVFVLGHLKKSGELMVSEESMIMPFKEMVLKICGISLVVYPLLYFLFGYFVLWQFAEARLLYSGSTDRLPFFSHWVVTFTEDPWLYPWQILRGLIWVTVAAPVIRMSSTGWKETGVITGLLFAILMNIQHMLPNPYMTPIIRMAHFLETAVSNFILGFSITWLLNRHHQNIKDLF
jgi:hypothetical protein